MILHYKNQVNHCFNGLGSLGGPQHHSVRTTKSISKTSTPLRATSRRATVARAAHVDRPTDREVSVVKSGRGGAMVKSSWRRQSWGKSGSYPDLEAQKPPEPERPGCSNKAPVREILDYIVDRDRDWGVPSRSLFGDCVGPKTRI